MERVNFRNPRGLALVGTRYEVPSDTIVLLVHGFASDRRSSGRFEYIARCLNDAGLAAFAFDFSGCGESDDDPLLIAHEVEDLRAALALAEGWGYRVIVMWGNSLGGRVCLEAVTPAVSTMVLTGGATGPMNYNWGEYFSAEQIDELQTHGRLTIHRSEGSRSRIVIDGRMLEEFGLFDVSAIFRRIHCPVLLIHGDGDEEERRLLGHSRDALRLLPRATRLEILPGAAHGFFGCIDTVVRLGLEWINERRSERR